MARSTRYLPVGLAMALVLWSAPVAAGTTLRRAINAEPGSLDPQSGDSTYQVRVDADLFEGLTAMAPGGHVVPGQAESWSMSPDGLVWSFTLRPDLTWSNGASLTAEDFVYSFRRLVDPAHHLRGAFLAQSIRDAADLIAGRQSDPTRLGVEAPDARTIRITLAAPNPALPEILTLLPPVYRAEIEQAGREAFRPGHLVGNGAYRLEEWQSHARLSATRNPRYRDAASVAIERVEYYPIEDQAEQLKRYRAGDLDLTGDIPGDQLDLVRRDLAAEDKASPAFGLYYLAFNNGQPPFKGNPKLREALTLAIDRQLLTDKILHGAAVPAYGWVPHSIEHYHNAEFPGAALEPAEREAAARRAYAEAGYSPDHALRLELLYNTSDNNRRLMIAIAAMWQQVLGVQTSLRNMELRSFLDLRERQVETQAFRAGFIAPYEDPQPMLELFRTGAVFNHLGYSNPDFDTLLAKAAVSRDPQVRLDGLSAAEAASLADFPAAPIYYFMNEILIKPYVTGWQPSPCDTFRTQDLAISPH